MPITDSDQLPTTRSSFASSSHLQASSFIIHPLRYALNRLPYEQILHGCHKHVGANRKRSTGVRGEAGSKAVSECIR
jgi:hypothetical protein